MHFKWSIFIEKCQKMVDFSKLPKYCNNKYNIYARINYKNKLSWILH